MMQALFVWIPKAAGQSILAALRRAGKTQDITNTRQQVFAPGCRFTTFHHHQVGALLRAGVIEQSWLDRQYVFTFVRNPWDRLVSLFAYLQRAHPETLAGRDFPMFLRAVADAPPVGLYSVYGLSQANPQTAWLDVPMQFVGRYEHLQRDWGALSRRLGIDSPLPHLNRSAHGDYRDYYTPALRDQVAEFYAEEIEEFGYEF